MSDDAFWWKSYRNAEKVMFDELIELTQKLGRLPTEEDVAGRVVIRYCGAYENFQALMKIVAQRTGRHDEWRQRQQELAELGKKRRDGREAINQKAAARMKVERRIQAAKERERVLQRQREKLLDQPVSVRQSPRSLAVSQQTRDTQEITPEVAIRQGLAMMAQAESTGMTLKKVDFSEVNVMMGKKSRHFSDERIYSLVWEILKQYDGDVTMAKARIYLDQFDDTPSYATLTTRAGGISDWVGSLQGAIENGKLKGVTLEELNDLMRNRHVRRAVETPVQNNEVSAQDSDASGVIAKEMLETAPETAAGVSLEMALEPQEVEVRLTGQAQLEMVWQGEPLRLKLTFG